MSGLYRNRLPPEVVESRRCPRNPTGRHPHDRRMKNASHSPAARSLPAFEIRGERLQDRMASVEPLCAIKCLQHAYGHYVALGLWNDFVTCSGNAAYLAARLTEVEPQPRRGGSLRHGREPDRRTATAGMMVRRRKVARSSEAKKLQPIAPDCEGSREHAGSRWHFRRCRILVGGLAGRPDRLGTRQVEIQTERSTSRWSAPYPGGWGRIP
jgi:hypothetical protein